MRPDLSSYPHLAAGKVRDLYAVDDAHLLMVASDRISAYDHVLPTPIPGKGAVLTAMSVFTFELLARELPGLRNHLAGDLDDERIPAEVLGRALVVRRLRMLPVECVARGYLTGSGLTDYRRTGAVCGVPLPDGLGEASRLPEPIFTPATKADAGDHDENVDFATVQASVGVEQAQALRARTLQVFTVASVHAQRCGLILADTKLELGLDADGELVLADEVLTPDSSRFWPADGYTPGRVQPSFDKQYVRDWLTSPASGWDRASDTSPPPLPDAIVAATTQRYEQVRDYWTQGLPTPS
ncbi:MAG: phosphoribosylaminoimidazolesuccinocarboxamide synthase [Mycobacteriaceae bacterium]